MRCQQLGHATVALAVLVQPDDEPGAFLVDLLRQGQGVILHMLSALPRYGKFGAVCVGRDQSHAAKLMNDLRLLVDDWAGTQEAGNRR